MKNNEAKSNIIAYAIAEAENLPVGMGKAFDVAIQALEKQMPKKPIDKTKPDDGASLSHINCHIIVCPSCNGRLKLKSKGRYCDKCGQRLDWGMKNEVN